MRDVSTHGKVLTFQLCSGICCLSNDSDHINCDNNDDDDDDKDDYNRMGGIVIRQQWTARQVSARFGHHPSLLLYQHHHRNYQWHHHHHHYICNSLHFAFLIAFVITIAIDSTFVHKAPKRMSFQKNSERPFPSPSFSENHIANFSRKTLFKALYKSKICIINIRIEIL